MANNVAIFLLGKLSREKSKAVAMATSTEAMDEAPHRLRCNILCREASVLCFLAAASMVESKGLSLLMVPPYSGIYVC